MRDFFGEIMSTVGRNKLRTALTGFAVAWGIFMLITLLGAGNGLINANLRQRQRFLSNSMEISGGTTAKAFDGLKEGRSITLDDKDIGSTERNFSPTVEMVGATIGQSAVTISLGENYVSKTLQGVFPNEREINKREMRHGRFINELDMERRRKVLVIGEDDAKELLPGNARDLVGRYVKVGGSSFLVVGIYKSEKSGMRSDAITAFTTLRTMYNKGDKASSILFSFQGLGSERECEDFKDRYRSRINENHRAAPDDARAIWIWDRFTMNLQMNTAIGIIRTALWVIGLFTLLSGVVGVGNIMLITVRERTREFGIRKAIGARPASILRLIITESVVITTFFGYIGMVLGVLANEYMDRTIGHTTVNSGIFEATMFYDPTVGLDVCLGATLVMIVAGTLAGLVPARKAAGTRPIEALRAE